jgi:hypothetical protein
MGPLGKSQVAFRESLHHCECGARFAKEAKDQPHRAPHFFVQVKEDTASLVVAKTDRKWETQFTFPQLC